jgi:zinc protease
MEGQANYLAEWEALGDWRLGDRYLERLLITDGPQVVDVAKRYLAPGSAGVLVYRPNGSPLVADRAEAMLELLERDGAAPLAPSTPFTPRLPARVAGAPRLEVEEGAVRVYRSETGLPILVRRKPGAPLTHVGVFVLGGASEEEDALGGLTTLMVRTALKGTAHRTALQIAEEGEMLGGSVGGSAGGDSFGWTISVPARYTAAGVELLADVAQYPDFPADALETERGVALADVVAVRDDMFRYPMRLASQAAFRGHPYGIPVSGTEESLPRIARADVERWHRERVLGAQAQPVVALVGDGDADELATLAARAFTALRHEAGSGLPAPTWPSGLTTVAEQREKAQTALALLFPGPARSDTDRFAAGMIASVASGLGGRFFDELRDKRSLCYTVTAFSSARRVAGTFGAYIATSPEKEGIAREGLLAEFGRLRDQPVEREELQRAQMYAIGVNAIQQQSGGAVLSDVIDAWLFGTLRDLEEYERNIRAVTASQMQRVARRYFDPERRVEGIVRGVGKMV